MRYLSMFAALAGLFVLAGAAWAQTPPAPATPNDCDLATVERLPYCGHCRLIITDQEHQLREGKCAACQGAVAQVECCIKHYWKCAMATCHATATAAGNHCEQPMTEQWDRCRVVWRCPTCRTTAEAAGNCHGANCDNAALVRSCERSGTWPHALRQGH